SKISESMRSDCASMPTRGSRFTGLLSMIMTSVLGSGLRAQEVSKSPTTKKGTVARRIAAEPSSEKDRNCCGWVLLLHIRNLAENRRPACAGGRGDIRRLAQPGLIGEYGEGDCLFCV